MIGKDKFLEGAVKIPAACESEQLDQSRGRLLQELEAETVFSHMQRQQALTI